MRFEVGSFATPSGGQYYIYIDGDTCKRLCIMIGDYNTEHSAQTLADTLNNRKEINDGRHEGDGL